MSNQALLFLIVGKNEPLYEVEIHKRGSTGNSDAVARQSYFVVHSSLDLVETAAWVTQNVRDRLWEKRTFVLNRCPSLSFFAGPNLFSQPFCGNANFFFDFIILVD
jgi:hypothetical protein